MALRTTSLPARPATRVLNPKRQYAHSRGFQTGKAQVSWGAIAFLLGHVPFAFLMKWLPLLAQAHSLAVLAVGLWFATRRGNSFGVARVAAYLVGSELLWRMCGGGVFLEFGKYAFALILGVALWRQRNRSLDKVAMWYFLLLLPSIAFALISSSLYEARTNISFYLSGPLALVFGVYFFKGLRLTPIQLRAALLSLIAPILGAAAICYKSTFGSDDITFGTSANNAASGGFGANQVSASFGLGIAAVALCWWLTPVGKLTRCILVAAVLFFVTQALLTMSRTGLWLATISCGLGGLQLARNPRQIVGLMVSAALAALLVWLVVVPSIEKLAGNAVWERFQKTQGSGRENIVQADLYVWAHHPLFGVGVGRAIPERVPYLGLRKASHTEYTRLLSEHGLLGAISLVLLLYIPARAFRAAKTVPEKVLAATVASFGLLFMMVSATRMLIPSFLLGLACVRQIAPQIKFNRPQIRRIVGQSAIAMQLEPQRSLPEHRIYGAGT